MFNIYFFLFAISFSSVIGGKDNYTYVSDFSQDDCTAKNDGYGYYYYHLENENVSPYCHPFKKTYTSQACKEDPKLDINICSTAYKCIRKCSATSTLKLCTETKECADISPRSRCNPFCGVIQPKLNNVGTCLAYYAKTKDYESTFYSAQMFKPRCLNDGSWAPKQCKGGSTGRCFCYNGEGGRIFGQAKFKDAKDMTCACSRRKYELTQSYDVYSSMHCDSTGNYEPLQCDRGFCWCAESKTGDLTSPVVPESNMKRLPCYDVNKVGDQYLRQCDSELWAISKISYKFKLHGVEEPNFRFMDCDYDGAFGRFNIISGMAYCTWRDNTKLLPYVTEWRNVKSADEITCHCARDEKMKLNQQPCEGTGNYITGRAILAKDKYYCLDLDGYQRNTGDTKIPDCSKVY